MSQAQPNRLLEIANRLEEIKKHIKDKSTSDPTLALIEAEMRALSQEVTSLLLPIQKLDEQLKLHTLDLDRLMWLRNKAAGDLTEREARSRPDNLNGYIYVDRQEIKEISYLDKLSPKERNWYNRFLDNYYNARFKKDGKDIITDPKERRVINQEKSQRRRASFENQGIRTKLTSDLTPHYSKPKPKSN